MARRSRVGETSYTRTARVRGREHDGRFALVQEGREHTRVVARASDGSAAGEGELVPTTDVYDIRPTHIVPTGQRGTITLPGELRRNLGIEEGTPLEITQEVDGRISIKPLRPIPEHDAPLDLGVLLAQVKPDNLHCETDTGSPTGREVW